MIRKTVNIPFEMSTTVTQGLNISFNGYEFSKKTGNKNDKYEEFKSVQWKCNFNNLILFIYILLLKNIYFNR